ncbi:MULTISPECIES: chondroitinase-B domain-containing protein [unclassified Myxococcus]|uniref:chondroitinase-B domain-containing protein n=1 Tax=unclassified Myxococcus TaxID=2648731 RepID=UPI0021123A85|nr:MULTISPECIES: chondroitinase-B domain-containing protein [unclassified Myxococcus]
MRKLRLAFAVTTFSLLLSAGCGSKGTEKETPPDDPSPDTSPSVPGDGTPDPTPGTGDPDPTPGTGEPDPTPGTGDPDPTPGTGEPDAGTPPTTDPGPVIPDPTDPEPPVTTPPEQVDVLPTPKRTLSARNLNELRSMIASALPGDRIELADGAYTNADPIEVSVQGTEKDPIVITAKTVGGASIGGASSFLVEGASHVILRGFKLTHAVEEGDVALRIVGSTHVRFTRNEFAIKDTTSISTWMRLEGAGSGNNRIDHNHFHDKKSSNVFLAVYGDAPNGSTGMSQNDRIDHNFFQKLTLDAEGGECLRIGDSKRGPISAHTVVEANLFEECNGDPEVISNKSSENVFRGNTLRNNKGSLVLRHGNKNVVDGNFILNNAGGLRIYGHDHLITNNYIEGSTGTGAQGTIVLSSGCTEEDTGLGTDCSVANRVTVAFNTLVGNGPTHLVIGASDSRRPIPARDLRVENNLLVGEQGALVDFERAPDGFTAVGNMLWGAASPGDIPSAGYVRADPKLVRAADGLLRPTAASPVIGAARPSTGTQPPTTDMDGQARTGALDVGADQTVSGAGPRRPLTSADVGPLAP